MTTLKITKIGDAAGIELTQEMLDKLCVLAGDEIRIVETPIGYEITRDEDVARQVEVAERVMREDRDILKKLAE